MLLGTTYLLEGFVRVQTRAGVPREQTALVFGDNRISHSEPSVCATMALRVGRVLRRRTSRVPPCFAGPQLETDDGQGLRPYMAVVPVLLHELTHNVWSDHGSYSQRDSRTRVTRIIL